MTSQEIAMRDLCQAVGVKRDKAIVILSSGTSLSHEFDVSPTEFLQQAEDDFELGGNNARLNSLSNSKRAIHAQVDEVLFVLGLSATRLNFPKKMELLADLGFVSPRILKRVNDARNVLEHDYQAPTAERLEEAIDLANLFLGATKRHLEQWATEFSIGNDDEKLSDGFINEIGVQFEQEQKSFSLAGYRGIVTDPQSYGIASRANAQHIGEIEVKSGQSLFNDLVRLVLAAQSERKTRKAVHRLFSRLGI
jgi:hypothetical protein